MKINNSTAVQFAPKNQSSSDAANKEERVMLSLVGLLFAILIGISYANQWGYTQIGTNELAVGKKYVHSQYMSATHIATSKTWVVYSTDTVATKYWGIVTKVNMHSEKNSKDRETLETNEAPPSWNHVLSTAKPGDKLLFALKGKENQLSNREYILISGNPNRLKKEDFLNDPLLTSSK